MRIRHFLARLAVVLGLLGVVGCVGGMVGGVWFGSRLSRGNDRAFRLVDTSLAAARDRVLKAQRRVSESKISADQVQDAIGNWTKGQVRQEVASRLQVEERAGKLALGLQQAGDWLETAAASVRGLQSTLDLGSSIGVPADGELLKPVLGKLADLAGQLRQAQETANDIRDRAAASSEGEPRDDRIGRAVQMAARVVATLGAIEPGLGEAAQRLSERQARMEQLRVRTHRYIVLGVIVMLLLLSWMAAGQVALCVYGWRNRRPARGTAKLGQT
jgi:hypothetical protein